jgi:hypothetical protein
VSRGRRNDGGDAHSREINPVRPRTQQFLLASLPPFADYVAGMTARPAPDEEKRQRPREQFFYGEFDGGRRKRVLLKIIGE